MGEFMRVRAGISELQNPKLRHAAKANQIMITMKKLVYFLLLIYVLLNICCCTKDPVPEETTPEDIAFSTSIRKDTTIILRVDSTFKLLISPESAKVEITISLDHSYYNSPTVITVNEDGLIKALGKGKAYVTLKNNKTYFTFNVVVVELPTSLYIVDSLVTIKTGRRLQLHTRNFSEYQKTYFGDLKWETSDNSIAHVTNDGYVTGLKEGSVKVRVSMINYPAISSESSVHILNHIVYLAGTAFSDDGGISASWRNNAGFGLHVGDFYIHGMEYFDENLYLVGFALLTNNIETNRAFMIKNSTKTIFSEGGACGLDVTHFGNDIYVCGFQTQNGIRTVALWKNSVPDPILSDIEITSESKGECIVASEGNIYVGGYVKNAQGIQTACYWKNKQRTDLTDGTINSKVNSIFVNGNDVFAVGSVCVSSNTLVSDGCYWKNGLKCILQPNRSVAKSIFVSNGNVYIAGSYENNENSSVACFWKNGLKYDLPLAKGAISGYANSISIIDGDEYISGYYTIQGYYTNGNTNKSIGCYWRNGIRFDIPPSQFSGYVGKSLTYSIVSCMTID